MKSFRREVEKMKNIEITIENININERIETIRNQTQLLSVQLEASKETQSKQVSVDCLRERKDLIVETIMANIFEELNLSSQESPVFLVATDRLAEEQGEFKKGSPGILPQSLITASRASSNDSYKIGIGEKLKRILRKVNFEREECKQSSGGSLYKVVPIRQAILASKKTINSTIQSMLE